MSNLKKRLRFRPISGRKGGGSGSGRSWGGEKNTTKS